MHHHPHEHPHTRSETHTTPAARQRPSHVDRRTMLRSTAFAIGAAILTACTSNDDAAERTTANPSPTPDENSSSEETAPDASAVDPSQDPTEAPAGFAAFAETVAVTSRGDVWLVESNGIPLHPMMIGITNWQQQVPLPQPYTGDNAWQFPTTPEMADEPISARTGLFRGAIAIAVNGIPIFNALNNRGDDAYLIGELDDYGGHCGRADDYHYHIAPLHLADAVGETNPIAWALDGYPIYGTAEPDGSPLQPLDDYNGHIGPDGSYHYHGTTTYPYINGGLVGTVETTDQIEPQPETRPIRPAGEPLPGATITGFDDDGNGAYHLEYTIGRQTGTIDYTITDTTVAFTMTDPDGVVTTDAFERS